MPVSCGHGHFYGEVSTIARISPRDTIYLPFICYELRVALEVLLYDINFPFIE